MKLGRNLIFYLGFPESILCVQENGSHCLQGKQIGCCWQQHTTAAVSRNHESSDSAVLEWLMAPCARSQRTFHIWFDKDIPILLPSGIKCNCKNLNLARPNSRFEGGSQEFLWEFGMIVTFVLLFWCSESYNSEKGVWKKRVGLMWAFD